MVVDVAAAWDSRLVGGVNVPEQGKKRQLEAVSELWDRAGRGETISWICQKCKVKTRRRESLFQLQLSV